MSYAERREAILEVLCRQKTPDSGNDCLAFFCAVVFNV